MSTTLRTSRLAVAALAATALLALAGCSNADPTGTETTSEPAASAETSEPEGDGAAAAGPVIVGSFAFPESEILGEMYAQALEAAGLEVETKFNIGPRTQTIPALQDGSINLIPEYNGNLLASYNPEYTERTTEEVNAALVDAVAVDGLQVLESATAEDKDAYVVTPEFAAENGLVAIGDLAKVTPFTLGAYPQLAEFGYGIPGLASVYGVEGVDFLPIEDFGGPDTVAALLDGTVQVADIFTTSPAIATHNLVVLEDPENMLSAQNITPLLADSVYSDTLADTLNGISAVLTTEDLIALRDRVEGDEKASAGEAATDWLTDKGLLG